MTTSAERVRFLIGLIASALLCCFLIIIKTEVSATTIPEDLIPDRAVIHTAQNAPKPEAAKKPIKEEKKASVFSGTVRKPSMYRPGADPFEQAIPETTADAQSEEVRQEELRFLDTFTATAYCTTGTTATGTQTVVGRTLAVNPAVIPYGTHVWLFTEDGELIGDYYAEDTGSNMLAHPYVIDIYLGEDSYDECIQWGAQRVLVYTEPEE